MHGEKKKVVCSSTCTCWNGKYAIPPPPSYWSILMSVCILMYDGPRHCAGPKLTCEDSVNSLWQSISSWQRHYSSAGREPAAGKHGNWHLQYDSSQHSHHHLSLSPSLLNSHTQSYCQALGRPPTEKLTINSANRILLAPPFLRNVSCYTGHRKKKKGDNLW